MHHHHRSPHESLPNEANSVQLHCTSQVQRRTCYDYLPNYNVVVSTTISPKRDLFFCVRFSYLIHLQLAAKPPHQIVGQHVPHGNVDIDVLLLVAVGDVKVPRRVQTALLRPLQVQVRRVGYCKYLCRREGCKSINNLMLHFAFRFFGLLNVRNRMPFCRAKENLKINGSTMKMITNTRMQILHVARHILREIKQREGKAKKNWLRKFG